MKPRVFLPEPIAASGLELLRGECECLAPWDKSSPRNREGSLLDDADAVIVRLFRIVREDLDRAKRLKVIAKHGVGVDNIDCEAATMRGIPVVYTPTANTNAVVEHTVCLMLALARQICPAIHALRDGWFSESNRFQEIELRGKMLGIVGLGRIGIRVAETAAKGFGMQVCAYDPFLDETPEKGLVSLEKTLEAVMEKADFLSLHLPLKPETRHLINSNSLKHIKPGSRLVNTSRGGVIDELDLVRALEEGQLAGAALDVFEKEPLPADHPLRHAPNVLLTPHISSATPESLERMALQAARGVLDWLHGKRPEHVVNPDVFLMNGCAVQS